MDEDDGIFLFKDSKTKISNVIFSTTSTNDNIDTNTTTTTNNSTLKYGKWFKTFLKRFQNPSGFFYPVHPIPHDQIISESLKRIENSVPECQVLTSKTTCKKITRGNRRHKIKTRRLRRQKTLKRGK